MNFNKSILSHIKFYCTCDSFAPNKNYLFIIESAYYYIRYYVKSFDVILFGASIFTNIKKL